MIKEIEMSKSMKSLKVKPVYVTQFNIYTARMPHSEVCIHMGISDKLMAFKLLGNNTIQFLEPHSLFNFSSPVSTGEAGLFWDADKLQYYFYPEM